MLDASGPFDLSSISCCWFIHVSKEETSVPILCGSLFGHLPWLWLAWGSSVGGGRLHLYTSALVRLIPSSVCLCSNTLSPPTTFSEPSWPPGEKAVSTPSPPFPTMVKACPSHPQHPHKMVPTRSFWSRRKLLVLRGTCGFLFAFHSLLLVNTSASVGLAPLNMNYYEFLP